MSPLLYTHLHKYKNHLDEQGRRGQWPAEVESKMKRLSASAVDAVQKQFKAAAQVCKRTEFWAVFFHLLGHGVQDRGPAYQDRQRASN